MGTYLIFSVSRGRGVARHRLNCGGRDKSGCLIHELPLDRDGQCGGGGGCGSGAAREAS